MPRASIASYLHRECLQLLLHRELLRTRSFPNFPTSHQQVLGQHPATTPLVRWGNRGQPGTAAPQGGGGRGGGVCLWQLRDGGGCHASLLPASSTGWLQSGDTEGDNAAEVLESPSASQQLVPRSPQGVQCPTVICRVRGCAVSSTAPAARQPWKLDLFHPKFFPFWKGVYQ